jgi:hypothetical protein
VFVPTDDFMCHQLVEPHVRVQLNDTSWAERAFFTVSHPDRLALDIGISMYPNNDVLESYAVVALPGDKQISLRASRELSEGRWPLWAGPVRGEILDPLKRWRLVCEENESGLEFDLVYEARAWPHETKMPTLMKKGRLMYDNVIVFQPGRYSGWVDVRGERFELDRLPGNRDRSWGIRASGEGRIARGLVCTLFAEFDDVSLLAMMYERHDGTPVVQSGAVTYDEGERVVPIVEFAHDLVFDHDSRQATSARITLTDEEGETWVVTGEPSFRLFLAGGGYTSDERRRGHLGQPFWTEDWDLADPATVRRVDNLNDNICHLRCGDREGHGIVETLLGAHDRYVVSPLD